MFSTACELWALSRLGQFVPIKSHGKAGSGDTKRDEKKEKESKLKKNVRERRGLKS